ncbi:MAG: GNAT family N-acetyltransferase [Alphaproteobacteria bacterium]|nr:GNAT family N-acetyltransferase [Alphaproteobacteria bacterium]
MFETPRLQYKIITHDDFEDVRVTLNNEHTCSVVSYFEWPLTDELVKGWCARSQTGRQNGKEFLFLAYKENQPAGYIGLHLEEPTRAQIGYWITEHFQGQGLAGEMVEGVCKLAFAKYHMEEIYATAAIDNPASHKVLLKNGFTITHDAPIALPNGDQRPSRFFSRLRTTGHA